MNVEGARQKLDALVGGIDMKLRAANCLRHAAAQARAKLGAARAAEVADFVASASTLPFHLVGPLALNPTEEFRGFLRPTASQAFLIEHVKHRIDADVQGLPSQFLVGDMNGLADLLMSTPAHELEFEVYGVQPGVSENDIDEHLADSMAFALEYVRRGGAVRAGWLISA